MGKKTKIKPARSAKSDLPLDAQMRQEEAVAPTKRALKKRPNEDMELEEAETEEIVGGKFAKKILEQARQQREEEEEGPKVVKRVTSLMEDTKKKRKEEDSEDDDDEEEEEEGADFGMDDIERDLRIHAADEKAFAMFVGGGNGDDSAARRTLGDIIREKKTEIETQYTDAGSLQRKELNPDLIELCEGVAQVLKRYRSGKVPKFFKMIPQYRNWEELLCLTEPDEWSAAAMFKATKIFVSGLREKMAQRFFNQYLLPRVRDDIKYYGRLNFHLFQVGYL